MFGYFIIFVVAVILAIWQGYKKNIKFCLLNIVIALISLLSVIGYTTDVFLK